MKTTMKLLIEALLVSVLLCTSCKKDNLESAVLAESLETEQTVKSGTDSGDNDASGSDGSDGNDGEDGADGTDGQDGQDGQDGDQGPEGPKGDTGDAGPKGDDGEDGNANVIASDWYGVNFGSFTSNRAHGDIKAPEITQQVLNSYVILGYVGSSDNPSQIFPMPWKDPLLGSIEFSYSVKAGYFLVHVERFIAGLSISPNWRFRYILIAPSSISGKGLTISSLQKMSYQEAMSALGQEL